MFGPQTVCPFHTEHRCEARSWGQVEKSNSQQSPFPRSGEHWGSPQLTWLPLASGCTWSRAGRGSGPGHRSPASPHTTRLLTWQIALIQRGRLAAFWQQAVPWTFSVTQLWLGGKITRQKQRIQNTSSAGTQFYDLGQHTYSDLWQIYYWV